MAGELDGVDRKIARAKRKLTDLDEAIKGIFDPDSYGFDAERDPQTSEHVYRVRNLPVIDAEWALEIGEVLYQLRSALDHLAWQLVKLDGSIPNEQTQFPIRDSPNDKNGDPLPLRDLVIPKINDPEILKLIDECQPYEAGTGERVSVDHARTTAPWHLHRLNIIDKHRLVLVVSAATDFDQMYWGLYPEDPVPTLTLNLEPLKEGDPVARFDFGGAPAPDYFDPNPAVRVTLRDPEAPALWHHPIIGVIENLAWFVEWQVVNIRFRPLFG